MKLFFTFITLTLFPIFSYAMEMKKDTEQKEISAADYHKILSPLWYKGLTKEDDLKKIDGFDEVLKEKQPLILEELGCKEFCTQYPTTEPTQIFMRYAKAKTYRDIIYAELVKCNPKIQVVSEETPQHISEYYYIVHNTPYVGCTKTVCGSIEKDWKRKLKQLKKQMDEIQEKK
jgi:hypothetical protein